MGLHGFVAAIFVLNPIIFMPTHQISARTSCMHLPKGLPWLALTKKAGDTGERPPSGSSPGALTTGHLVHQCRAPLLSEACVPFRVTVSPAG